MPGKTIYLTPNPNDFRWPIPDRKGVIFEDLIYKYLIQHLSTRDGRVKVKRTRRVGDAGRDFEISFFGEVQLFGMPVASPTLKRVVIFVECKSTQHERLDDEFIVDASQHQDDEAFLYVLVTNATLTPYCQYRAQLEWNRRGSGFCLIDKRRLLDELFAKKMEKAAAQLGLELPQKVQLPDLDRNGLTVACQLQSNDSGNATNIYVTVSNYGLQSILSEIGIASDLQWSADQPTWERVVTAGMTETSRLTATRLNFQGPADLSLSLTSNGRSHRLSVSSPNYQVFFEPHFTGREHLHLSRKIRRIAESTQGPTVISIQGEAGVGKTRTVKEALKPLINGQLQVFTYNFTRNSPSPSFIDFFDTFGFEDIAEDAAPALRLSHLIAKASETEVPVLLLFEDLHHADESIIQVFKKATLEPSRCHAALVLIVTGRDDHTFPNEEYFSFLQLINDQSLTGVVRLEIHPLTDEDAKLLIRSVVVNIPEPGVERVHRLGENNPFIIIEVIQYLLDTRLAQLLSRRTVGVLNPEIFAGRNGLPHSVEELYERRLAALRQAEGGEHALEFLTTASFFDFVIKSDVRRSFFDGDENGDYCWSLLLLRRFVTQDLTSDQSTFAHENLLHYIRLIARLPQNAQTSATALLRRPGLLKRLNILDQGEVHYLAGNLKRAFDCFASIWDRVKNISNFSSEEIDKTYFRYLPLLFEAAQTVATSKLEISKVALAHGYMGVHNYPLKLAEEACALSRQMLNQLYAKPRDGLRNKLAISQLRAHALQNMGRTGEALKEMLEIEAALSECNQDWPELSFDLFDRLQEYYRKANHAELSHFYGRQAQKTVERTGDEKLRAAHLITQSVVSLYLGEKVARQSALEAHDAARRAGIERFITYTRLTQLIVEALYSNGDNVKLKAIADDARLLLREAALKSFSDSIMRIELLLGTLALSWCEDPIKRHSLARFYVKSGQANSIRFGNGLFDWAFDNLAAVIDLEDKIGTDEAARSKFRSVLARIKLRELNFLGAKSGLYPNPFAISNVVRFFAQFRESEAVELIRSNFTAYDNRILQDDRALVALVARAANGRALFWPSGRRLKMLRYPGDKGYFTPVF